MFDIRFCPKFLFALVFAVGIDGARSEAAAVHEVEPASVAGKPGSIIRVWPLQGGGPAGADSFRILYRSTGLNGEPIAVSGSIFIPSGPAPAGGRNGRAWAHPTTGVVPSCGPSLMPDDAGMIWGLTDMLAQGYVVTATDYPGLGTPGPHPYLIGVSKGRAVLDSVRAAINLPSAGASNRFASLYAGELAACYAPDLKLVGVAAATPATYLVELFDADAETATGKELTAMALYSWSALYHHSAASLVEPGAMGEASYRRSAALDKRRQLMEAWSRYCSSPPRRKGRVRPRPARSPGRSMPIQEAHKCPPCLEDGSAAPVLLEARLGASGRTL